jgi:hypothetical protein
MKCSGFHGLHYSSRLQVAFPAWPRCPLHTQGHTACMAKAQITPPIAALLFHPRSARHQSDACFTLKRSWLVTIFDGMSDPSIVRIWSSPLRASGSSEKLGRSVVLFPWGVFIDNGDSSSTGSCVRLLLRFSEVLAGDFWYVGVVVKACFQLHD